MDTGKANKVTGYELRPTLRKFAEEMERTLRENDYKDGWSVDMCPVDYLQGRMIEEAGEWFKTRDAKELVDIANFAMMIWDRLHPIGS